MKQEELSLCAAGAQNNRGSGIPRKAPCVLRASCLGQVLGGSAPSCSHTCSCASEAKRSGAAPGRMLLDTWQRPPAAARKTSGCYSYLLSGAQLLLRVVQGSTLFRVSLHMPFLCHAQDSPGKLVGKEKCSPFKNRKGIGKKRGHMNKANI